MRTAWFIVAVFAGATALGQSGVPMITGTPTSTPYLPPVDYGHGGYGYYGDWSSTAGEGYARGLGDLFRSGGLYNLYSSAAAINLAEARRREIENDKAWVQAYFELRDYNAQKRDAQLKRDRGNPEDWTRMARAQAPKPLDNHDLEIVTGKLHWPILLTAREFADQRASLEKLFADRAYHGILEAEDFVTAVHVTDEMLTSLKSEINDVPAKQYLAARRFLQSLAYEAGQPAG